VPLYPPRSQEPYKKKETLLKREQQLRHALSSGAASERLHRAAEHVRRAQLAVLKAEQELVRYDQQNEERSRHLASIEKRRDSWQSMAVESILQQYSAVPR
jgi:hypothetical protein